MGFEISSSGGTALTPRTTLTCPLAASPAAMAAMSRSQIGSTSTSCSDQSLLDADVLIDDSIDAETAFFPDLVGNGLKLHDLPRELCREDHRDDQLKQGKADGSPMPEHLAVPQIAVASLRCDTYSSSTPPASPSTRSSGGQAGDTASAADGVSEQLTDVRALRANPPTSWSNSSSLGDSTVTSRQACYHDESSSDDVFDPVGELLDAELQMVHQMLANFEADRANDPYLARLR